MSGQLVVIIESSCRIRRPECDFEALNCQTWIWLSEESAIFCRQMSFRWLIFPFLLSQLKVRILLRCLEKYCSNRHSRPGYVGTFEFLFFPFLKVKCQESKSSSTVCWKFSSTKRFLSFFTMFMNKYTNNSTKISYEGTSEAKNIYTRISPKKTGSFFQRKQLSGSVRHSILDRDHSCKLFKTTSTLFVVLNTIKSLQKVLTYFRSHIPMEIKHKTKLFAQRNHVFRRDCLWTNCSSGTFRFVWQKQHR